MSVFLGHVAFGEAVVPPGLGSAMEAGFTSMREGQFVRKAFAGGLMGCFQWATPEQGQGGDQPVETEKYIAVAALRLDNRLQIERQLDLDRSPGLRDIELLLLAYEKWGVDCFDRLQGDWCCAIWDKRAHSLTLARDATGQSGLAWWHQGNQVVFSTNLGCVTANPVVPKVPNPLAVACFLTRFDDPELEDATFFTNVRRIVPGGYVQIDRSGLKQGRWWRPDDLAPLDFATPAECYEAFMAIYSDAVATRLPSSGSGGVALALSGGLDSSSVLALAAPALALQGKRLNAYVHRPWGGGGQFGADTVDDEYGIACKTAEFVGNTTIHSLFSEGVPWVTSIGDSLQTYGEPTIGACSHYWLESLMAAVVADRNTVLLTGQGGNGTVSWFGTGNLWSQVAARGPLWALNELRTSRLPWRKAVRIQVLSPMRQLARRSVLRSPWAPMPNWADFSAIHPEFARSMRLRERMRAVAHDASGSSTFSGREVRLWRLFASNGNSVGTRWMDLGNRYGISVRDPTRDRRVVEFCWRVSDDLFWGGGRLRMLVKGGFVGRLPPAMLARPVRGLQGGDIVLRAQTESGAIAQWTAYAKNNPLLSEWLDVAALQQIPSRLQNSGASDCYRILFAQQSPGLALSQFVDVQRWF
ncbi:MAG TPA: asparagine synthase-related protein [Burkholderiaceae bacterium]